ncbi:MAG: hypothetical protein GVY29_06795, partial [Spirochaetes bacterium]|nr:hypothetical protein [Spirochaetota bacterium]
AAEKAHLAATKTDAPRETHTPDDEASTAAASAEPEEDGVQLALDAEEESGDSRTQL